MVKSIDHARDQATREGLDSKTYSTLYDIQLLLHNVVKPQCINFARDTPCDPKTRKRDHTALSEGILRSILINLDYVQVRENEELRAFKKEITRKANDMLESIDQARDRALYLR